MPPPSAGFRAAGMGDHGRDPQFEEALVANLCLRLGSGGVSPIQLAWGGVLGAAGRADGSMRTLAAAQTARGLAPGATHAAGARALDALAFDFLATRLERGELVHDARWNPADGPPPGLSGPAAAAYSVTSDLAYGLLDRMWDACVARAPGAVTD